MPAAPERAVLFRFVALPCTPALSKPPCPAPLRFFSSLGQAAPYAWTTLFVPTHYLTHEVLLFLTGIWTTNIHDCIHGRCEPIMGAGYHTIHHTTYRHNYGHYTVLFDWLFGTLQAPQVGAAAGATPKPKKAAGSAKKAKAS